ncbi:class I SAM-dependent methyltransferase [Streptomyces sp. BE308]|uniref:class I SAM-dependent methyltransferase n=1 Tax=Streptomyces sp. BE308 TaxID=3002529 RepID=UPI002E76426A|nr:class I SAM-dependent methyltransferase [Streptomyces sp. BE308]MEE1789645.1 class I SAM-dependent methyltransferase [Streptomyces sp. BE308]
MTMDSQFDTAVAAYESSMEVMPFREHVEAYSFLNAVGDICGRDVLDLGCGSGLYARQLRRAGAARAVGMDESAPMVEHAQRREEHEGLGVEYVAANAADPTAGDLPGITGSFDVVTAVYVLPYASSPETLEGFCATARRALRATGGRFVAAVLNPEFSTDPEWYRGYGMLLTSQQSPAEGTPGHLRAWVGPEVLDLDFFRWSAAAHERALEAAGFDRVSWIRPTVSEEGRARYGEAFWANYLDCPHALIIDAQAGPGAVSDTPAGPAGSTPATPTK